MFSWWLENKPFQKPPNYWITMSGHCSSPSNPSPLPPQAELRSLHFLKMSMFTQLVLPLCALCNGCWKTHKFCCCLQGTTCVHAHFSSHGKQDCLASFNFSMAMSQPHCQRKLYFVQILSRAIFKTINSTWQDLSAYFDYPFCLWNQIVFTIESWFCWPQLALVCMHNVACGEIHHGYFEHQDVGHLWSWFEGPWQHCATSVSPFIHMSNLCCNSSLVVFLTRHDQQGLPVLPRSNMWNQLRPEQ